MGNNCCWYAPNALDTENIQPKEDSVSLGDYKDNINLGDNKDISKTNALESIAKYIKLDVMKQQKHFIEMCDNDYIFITSMSDKDITIDFLKGLKFKTFFHTLEYLQKHQLFFPKINPEMVKYVRDYYGNDIITMSKTIELNKNNPLIGNLFSEAINLYD